VLDLKHEEKARKVIVLKYLPLFLVELNMKIQGDDSFAVLDISKELFIKISSLIFMPEVDNYLKSLAV